MGGTAVRRKDAPRSSREGGPNAFLEIEPAYAGGLDRMRVGDEIIVITWLHQGRRDVLKVHPRGERSHPLVFQSGSTERPPLLVHA